MPVSFDRDVYCLLGLPFDAVDMADTIRHVTEAAVRNQPCFLSTPNIDWIIGCRTDSEFRDSVVNSDLNVADGMPLIWIARMLGIPLRERVAGSNLFENLRRWPGAPIPVFFFGGPDGAAEVACQRLIAEGRGLTCAGFESPGFGSVEDMSGDETIDRINRSNASFLVVSLGARKGQEWIERNRARISVPVISHLGAVLHFVAGTVKRAPLWMQSVGLEWLWRIKENPILWRRYTADGFALLALVATRVLPYVWYLRMYGAEGNQLSLAGIDADETAQGFVIRLRGPWSSRNIGPLRQCFSRAASTGKNVTLDLGGVIYIDSAFVALAILLHGVQKRNGRELLVVAAGKPVRRVITYCCAEYLYSSVA